MLKKNKIKNKCFIILEAPLMNASSAQGFLKSQQSEELNKLKLYAGYSRNQGSCMACFGFFIINFNFKLINNEKKYCWKRTKLKINVLSFLKLLWWMLAQPKVSWNPNRVKSSINWNSTLGIRETEGLAYCICATCFAFFI